ncbi:MAG TPA: hypothetical protein VEW91_11555 [bacterium]|nr:hypothetical protein [bacterium]
MQAVTLPSTATTEAPRISLRDNGWIAIPVAALVGAIRIRNFWLLNYVHVFSAILWTGTDIFMGFILGPVLRRVDLPTRRAIITRLMPRMVGGPGHRGGDDRAGPRFLLPINLRVYFEMCKERPYDERVRRLISRYVKIVASQAVLQFTIILIVARFVTGI